MIQHEKNIALQWKVSFRFIRLSENDEVRGRYNHRFLKDLMGRGILVRRKQGMWSLTNFENGR